MFEISVLIWALTRSGRDKVVFAGSTILLLLSLYQIMEILTCLSPTGSVMFAKLGYLAITWLPALGLLLICFLFPYRSNTMLRFVQLMLLASFFMNIWILADSSFVHGSVCSIVFARYKHSMPQFNFYGIYYHLGLMGMLVTSTLGIMKSNEQKIRIKLGIMLLGTITFIFPALLVVVVFTPADGSLTSVLCHFALFLAISITLILYHEKKELRG